MGDKEKGIMDLEEYVKLTGDLKTKEMINELKSVDDSPKFMKSLKWNEYGKVTDSIETIRKRFKTLALQYHPDKNRNEDAERKFIEIRKAYEYLTNHS